MSEYRDQMNDADRVIVAGMDLTDLYDFPFPDDVPLSDVPVVSLRKLIHSDEAEIEKMFNASKSPGAFVLDLTDHPKGLGYLRNAVECARLARDQLKIRAVEEKRAYKARPRVGIMDQGFVRSYLPRRPVDANFWLTNTIDTSPKRSVPTAR